MIEKGQPMFGIKGPTSLSKILSLPSQAPLDYMHLILQGHAKWLIRQYFFSDKNNDYFIGKFFKNIFHYYLIIIFKKTNVI